MNFGAQRLSGQHPLPPVVVAPRPSFWGAEATASTCCRWVFSRGREVLNVVAGLSGVHHTLPAHNAAQRDFRRQLPLLFRHGARALSAGFLRGAQDCRLYVDVTALILAAHLGVLDAVERAFAPLLPRGPGCGGGGRTHGAGCVGRRACGRTGGREAAVADGVAPGQPGLGGVGSLTCLRREAEKSSQCWLRCAAGDGENGVSRPDFGVSTRDEKVISPNQGEQNAVLREVDVPDGFS